MSGMSNRQQKPLYLCLSKLLKMIYAEKRSVHTNSESSNI